MELNIALIYQYIYIIIVAIITATHLNRYKTRDPVSVRNTNDGILLAIIATFAIGLRPISGYFVDMGNADIKFQKLQGEFFEFTFDTDNILFDNLFNWCACNDINLHLFFLLMAAIYFGCAYFGIRRLFGNHAMLAFLVFLAAFSTFSYGTNGVKAGAAASIFIMALSYWNKLPICVLLMLVSLGFHHSMIMPIAALTVVMFVKKPQYFFYAWFACLVLAVFHVTYFQFLFGSFSDEQGASYLLATEKTTEAYIGFRPDFVIYSAAPVWIGYRLEIKQKARLSKTYFTLMHFYLVTNAIWMLCMYASFNNRIAYLSWFVYPIVIIYPFLDLNNQDPERFMKLSKVVKYHLFFTMFMMFVFYGLLAL